MPLTPQQAGELVSALLGPGNWFVTAAFGAGRFSEVFSVEDGTKRYVLRVAPPDSMLQLFYEYRMMRREPGIHARLLAETGVPVPPILACDFSRERLDRDFLIMPRLPGEPLSRTRLSPAARDRALREWGMWVRQIHGIRDPQGRFGYLPGETPPGAPDPANAGGCMTPQASWPAAFTVMYRKLLDDVVRCGVYDTTVADQAMALLESHVDAFDHGPAPSLCHGDLWVTNLLVNEDGAVTGLLDFDRACWGDVEWDLAIAEYCGITQPAFWEGYGGRVETHRGAAGVRRFFYLLYEHQKYIVISMSGRRNDPAGAREYAARSLAAMASFRRTGRPDF